MHRQLSTEFSHVFRLALRFCRDRHLAEDLAQETMLKAVRKLDQLDSPDRLRVWLFRILTNTWRDHVRRCNNRPEIAEQVEPTDARHVPAEETAAQREQLQTALDAMDSLPEKQRAVLHLFAVEGLSLTEIGDALDMQPATAKVNLHHARKAMRKRLPEFAEDVHTVDEQKTEPVRPLP